MLWHPLTISVLFSDALGVVFLVSAAVTAVRVLLLWSPDSCEREQLVLERKAEAASFQGRYTVFFFVLGSMILVFGVAQVFPPLVPGAMCGTGVLQAMEGPGRQAVLLRGIALALLAAWHLLDRFNRAHPESVLVIDASRALLVSAPVMLAAILSTAKAFLNLDGHEAVACCAAVYDQFHLSQTISFQSIPERYWFWILTSFSLIILTSGVLIWKYPDKWGVHSGICMAVGAGIWVTLGALALTRVLSAYHYGVLNHRCLWCLFLPEHKLVGYPLFGSLGIVGLEGGAIVVSLRLGARIEELREAVRRRIQAAGVRLILATALFLFVGGLPAVIWRLRFGVWMQ